MFNGRRSGIRAIMLGLVCVQLVMSGGVAFFTPAAILAAPQQDLTAKPILAAETDNVQPHTVVSTCTDAGLAAAITAGGSITFNCPSPYTINLSSQKSINATVSIDGSNGGHQMIIDGGNAYRVFYVNGAAGNLTLNNIKIAHGHADSAGPVGTAGYGGGIYNAGTLSLTYVFLDTNAAGSYGGGGIYNAFGATATLNQAYFDFNSANYGGGGLFNDGTLKDVYSGHYNNNTTDNYGAGIFFNGGQTTFSYVTFDSNISGGNGGAIYTNNGALTTTNTTSFTNNQAKVQGGAIYNGLSGSNMLRIDNATFTGNKVTGYDSTAGSDGLGGAIYTYRTGAVNISNSTFTSNSAKGGNGSNYGGTGYGGAIAMAQSGTSGALTITNSIFNTNKALGGDGSGNYGGDAYGGAISAGYGPKTIISTTFNSNTAQGGKGYGNGSGRAYGGAFSDETNVAYRVSSSIFYGNTAQGGDSAGHGAGSAFGGAIDNDNNALPFLLNSTIFGNQALGGVGGASNYGGDAYGGGVYNYAGGASLTIINNTLSQNSARGGTSGLATSISKGGGLYSASGSGITISNTINSGNTLSKNCDGQIIDGGYNLEYGINTCGLSAVKNDQSGDPKLALPADNGGPTQTQALGAGSAAIDNANDVACAGTNINNRDQRGFARPFGNHCDIGAYEFVFPTITTSFTPAIIGTGQNSVLTFALNNSSGVNITSVSFSATLASQITLSSLPGGSCGGTVNVNGNVISVSGISLANAASCSITANVTATALGIYFNNTSPLTSTQFGTVGVGSTTTLTVSANPPPPVYPYNYNLPLLANGANTPVGQTTTYVTFQNLANSPANFTLQYYDINTGAAAAQQVFTLPALGQAAPTLNLTPGQSYGGIVGSNQPLNLVVAEGLSSGGSAYNVSSATASTLYSPLALNGQYGFQTAITVFNGGSATSTGNVLFFDDAGNAVPGATKPFNVPAHASQTFKQADAGSGLASNHAYWAKIVATNASDSLTAQVIEFGPGNFVATFNAIVPSQVASTLYAPATFNGNYNFVTGIALANPNGAAASVNIKYYVADGTNVFTQTNVPIAANGVIGIFQPNVSGLPTNVTSAVISSNQPLISTVNERGPGTIAGTYVGLATGKTNVALPVMANGAFGFVTGATVFNTGSSPAHFTFSYLKPDGTSAVAAQSITLAPNASFLVYQGDATQNLASGFFGTAVLTSDQPLLVTTNALNTSNNLFYTYTEPS